MNLGMDDSKEKTKPILVPAIELPEANSQFAESIKTPTNKMLSILMDREENDVN